MHTSVYTLYVLYVVCHDTLVLLDHLYM